MNNNYKIFTTSWFIFGLSLLLLNDFVFKEIFGNGLTGKLSDFAGLLIFPLFWTAFFPRRKKTIFLLTALLFILWKSSWSQPFINGWNSLGLFSISRVIDYTDLYALAILPLAYHLESVKLQLTTIQSKPIIPILIAAFAFGATSYSSNVEVDKPYTVNMPKDSLYYRIQRLDSVYFTNPNQRMFAKMDTVKVSFQTELCFDNAEVNVAIEEHKDGTTTITILDALYPCPKEKDEEEKIIKGFEKRVIEQIAY